MREFLRGLEFDEETIDTIMAEYGKLVTKDKEKIQELQNQVQFNDDDEKKLHKFTTDAISESKKNNKRRKPKKMMRY